MQLLSTVASETFFIFPTWIFFFNMKFFSCQLQYSIYGRASQKWKLSCWVCKKCTYMNRPSFLITGTVLKLIHRKISSGNINQSTALVILWGVFIFFFFFNRFQMCNEHYFQKFVWAYSKKATDSFEHHTHFGNSGLMSKDKPEKDFKN